MRDKIDWNAPTCRICFERGHDDKDCTEDKNDFKLVGTMAAFIGARLNYTLPECNSGVRGGKPVSTIEVGQHKEKFWYVIVYCTLADEKLVSQKWLAEREREADGEATPPAFWQKCFDQDAWHYRHVYLDMMRLVPSRMHKRIRARADYRELLFATVDEMNAQIDELSTEDAEREANRPAGDRSHVDSLEYYRKRYRVSTNEELKQAIGKYYAEPSMRLWLADS